MKNRYIFLGDILLVVAACFGAFALRFDWRFYLERHEFLLYLGLAVMVKLPIFYVFGLYRRLWRYASVFDMVATAVAVLMSSMIVAALMGLALWLSQTLEMSRAVVLIDALLTLVCLGGLRLSVRALAEARGKARTRGPEIRQRRVLIAGAGDAGAMVARELRRNPQLGMTPVGFLDDDRAKRGQHIHGLKVLGDLNALAAFARSTAADEVLIAMPKASGAVLRGIAESCRAAMLASRTIPGVFELLDGQVSVSRLRQVDISDLLRRSPITGEVDTSLYVTGHRVLVTGAGGSIGFEVCRQIAASHPSHLVMLGHGENSLFDAQVQLRRDFPGLRLDVAVADVRDDARLKMLFERFRPQVVLHAAAHKHVPLMEDNPEEAISNNVIGTRNIVNASLAIGVERLVMISTDKAVSPSCLMGASKRVAESIVRAAAKRHGAAYVVVRFGNVLGSRGSVVPYFKRQIEQGGPITVTHPEMRRFFMTIPEAVHLVLQAGGIGRGGELFVLEMGAPVRIVDLAQDLIALSGFQPSEIPIVFSGVRPGEKLEEELWEKGATVEVTDCASVLRVTEPELFSGNDVDVMVDGLLEAATTGDRMRIEAELARWITTYVPASAMRHMSISS